MTDSEKLDIILEEMKEIRSEIKELKRQQMKNTSELKAMDELILDEVERVHENLLKKQKDLEKKIG